MRSTAIKKIKRVAAQMKIAKKLTDKQYAILLKNMKKQYLQRNQPITKIDFKAILNEHFGRKERRRKRNNRQKALGLRRRNGGNWSWVPINPLKKEQENVTV